jgi:opacity protein-like surface antigen
MIRLPFARLMIVLVVFAAFTTALSAQKGEVYVFGGGYWKGSSVFDTHIPGGGTYGVKAGGFFSKSFELSGNASWYNHFQTIRPDTIVEVITPGMTILDPKVRSWLFEADGTYHFAEKSVGTRFTPYATFGIGWMRAKIKDADSVFVTGGGFIQNPLYITDRTPVARFIPNPARRIVMDDGDKFLTFSYGGGLKAMRIWGPTGFRVDFRGRTIPNFFSQSLTRPELSAGLIFNWGER